MRNLLLILGTILVLGIVLYLNFIWVFILLPIGLTTIGKLF